MRIHNRYTVRMNSATCKSALPILHGPACTLPQFGSVRAGFASPADDHLLKRVDLTAELVRHPQATFLVRISGDSMRDHGIFDGDTVVVDRALQPKHCDVVIAVIDGEFVCKQLWRTGGTLELRAGNPDYPSIVPHAEQTWTLWGVVTSAIKRFR